MTALEEVTRWWKRAGSPKLRSLHAPQNDSARVGQMLAAIAGDCLSCGLPMPPDGSPCRDKTGGCR